jgi:hypothetical protein
MPEEMPSAEIDRSQIGPSSRKRRLLVLIDGVYFQTAMRKAGVYFHLDYPRLARALAAKIEEGSLLVKLRFFIAPSPDRETRRKEQPLFDALNASGSTDRDLYDTALLVTGDEDYVRAITAARDVRVANGVNPGYEKRVIWGHFGIQATNGRLSEACDGSFLFEEKLLRTVKRVNFS